MTNGWTRAKIAGSLAALVGSFAMSAVTWIGIGGIAGYGPMRYVMPLVVDAYIICAIATGMSTDKPGTARSAYYHALSAAIIGTLAQAIYHCAGTWAGATLWFGKEYRHVTWAAALAFVAGGLPPFFAFLGVHLLGTGQRNIIADPTASNTSPQFPPASPPQTTSQNLPAATQLATTPVITSPTTPQTAPTPTTMPPTRPPLPPPPRPTLAPATTRRNRTPRTKSLVEPHGQRFPQRLTETEIRAIYDGLASGLSQPQIAKRIGRSEAVVQKYAAIRREQLAATRATNGKAPR